jgi:hypothetical protein
MHKNYDKHGQRLTDCCGSYATYGNNVTIHSLDTARLICSECRKPTGPGQGDQTEFIPGVTFDSWIKAIKKDPL